jgi:hypothetical protein
MELTWTDICILRLYIYMCVCVWFTYIYNMNP